jgi:hypothetical protein
MRILDSNIDKLNNAARLCTSCDNDEVRARGHELLALAQEALRGGAFCANETRRRKFANAAHSLFLALNGETPVFL